MNKNMNKFLITDEAVMAIQPQPHSFFSEIYTQVARIAIRQFEKQEKDRHREAFIDTAVDRNKYIQEQKLMDDARAGTKLIIDEEEFKARAYNRLGRNSALKRAVNIDDSPVKDQSSEDQFEERPRRDRKVKRLIINEDEPSETKQMKKKPKRPLTKVHDSYIPDLPEKLENAIKTLNGTRLKLLIQKELTGTDVSKQHNRLSIMQSQFRDADFLMEEEKKFLSTRIEKSPAQMRVRLIQPSGEECEITFKKWDLKSSLQYVFITEWTSICKSNNLVEGTVVQVWSFRTPDGALGFALAKVKD